MSQERETSDHEPESNDSPTPMKRKRLANAETEELEIDLNQPEPPSKKAKRQQKKAERQGKLLKAGKTSAEKFKQDAADATSDAEETQAVAKRSEWSVWIGNLTWTTTKDDLREFFASKGDIPRDDITRLHMPPPPDKGPAWKGPKPTNKGFAYVDFSTEEEMTRAIGLSEYLLGGRKVLIKNAKSFEGRPDVKLDGPKANANTPTKEPSKRIFVGGLSFDVTKDDLQDHFAQAGELEDVFLATFEDSGKCKGFGFVRFTNIDAAKAAVQGFVYKDRDEQDASEEEASENEAAKPNKRVSKKRKWYINRLHGRPLRCEFAEDAQSRYKKRFGKEKSDTQSAPRDDKQDAIVDVSDDKKQSRARLDKDERQAQRRRKHEDARLVAPGRALANAKRMSQGIVAGSGTKTTFD